MDRYSNAAFCRAIQLRQDNAGDICHFLELPCLRERILSGRAVQNDQSLPVSLRVFAVQNSIDLSQFIPLDSSYYGVFLPYHISSTSAFRAFAAETASYTTDAGSEPSCPADDIYIRLGLPTRSSCSLAAARNVSAAASITFLPLIL